MRKISVVRRSSRVCSLHRGYQASIKVRLRPARPSLRPLAPALAQVLTSGIHTWPPYEYNLTSGIASNPIIALVQPALYECFVS